MKILVTGASGFLGKRAMELFGNRFEVVGTSFSKSVDGLLKVDITDKEELRELIDNCKPDVIFHTAAIVDVDLCEKENDKCRKVNVDASCYLAELCKEKNVKLVLTSSDYIFSGENSPYNEDSEAHPKSYYGNTKLMMEQEAIKVNPDVLIIRLPILYGMGNRDKLVLPTVESIKQGKEIVIDDYRKKYPVLIDDVVKNAIILIEKGEKGIFHFASKKELDRFEIANTVAKVFKLDTTLDRKSVV